jgi:CDP-diacylglycerol--glycerol-3-phosphate 3-phosphatidyltransferase
MSWAHVLSFSRVVAGPIVAALVLAQPGNGYLLAATLFAAASLTDLIDGKLARHRQQVSPLGVFLDTTSDKVLVSLVLVAMAIAGLTWAWLPLIVIGREFLISGLRSYAASYNRIISAHIWGKGKAAVTMVAITALLATADGRFGGVLAPALSHNGWARAYAAAGWLLGLAAVLTVVSGARYLLDAWPLLRSGVEDETQQIDQPRRAAGGQR